jgi:hypothetical protein
MPESKLSSRLDGSFRLLSRSNPQHPLIRPANFSREACISAPLAVTFSPAKAKALKFYPLVGVVSAILLSSSAVASLHFSRAAIHSPDLPFAVIVPFMVSPSTVPL